MRRVLAISLAIGCGSISGCSGPSLRVTSEPPGAMIVVSQGDRADNSKSRLSPHKFGVRFKNDPNLVYTVQAIPPEAALEKYQTTTVKIDQSLWNRLPGDNLKDYTLRLEEATYGNLLLLEVVLDPTTGWRAVLSERRAYTDTREQTGEAPTQIVRFGELANVHGMSLSGNRIVYSVASGFDSRELRELADLQQYDRWVFPLAQASVHGVLVGPQGGGGIQQITTGDFLDLFPSFTPDGEYLLFTSNRRNRVGADLLRIRASDRGAIQNLLVETGGNRASKPTQGEDATIAYSLYPAGAVRPDESQIWTIGGPNQFPTQVSYGQLPAISPDGKRIAFIRDGNLWVCRASGGGETQLTSDAAAIVKDYRDRLSGELERQFFDTQQLNRTFFANGYPTWSPDGNHIVYSSMQGRDPTGRPNEDIWLIRADGTDAQQLTTNFSADRFPVLSPDGRYIYFFSNRGKQWGLWRIAAPEILRQSGSN